MWWCQSNDSFIFKLNSAKLDPAIVNGDRKPTKREVLRTLMSIFDPLGLLANFLVYVKILLQEEDLQQDGTIHCLTNKIVE